jgi:hypothetical protein
MSEAHYQPDHPADATDALIMAGSGPEPPFDSVMQVFLRESYLELKRQCERGGLLEFASLGLSHPSLFRLTFQTRGLVRDTDGEVATVARHVVALRFPLDYLRNADRFAMLRLVEPASGSFHPNISPAGAICVEIYPGETLVEICQSLHDLFRWRLRQYDERDALNSIACAWGRENIEKPIDDRPLFGQRLKLQWHTADAERGSQ